MGLFQKLLGRHGRSAGRFLAAVTQSSSGAPTLDVIENSLVDAAGAPVTITPARTGTGVYTLTAGAACFTTGRTAVKAGNRARAAALVDVVPTSTTVLTLNTTNAGNAADGLMTAHVVEVEVYPAAA
ncbi:MAG TPA: hypothetical protein VK610_04235 [Rhodothermales bacterium]|nr:hypothetical protein [Rhodothermales bacterium]